MSKKVCLIIGNEKTVISKKQNQIIKEEIERLILSEKVTDFITQLKSGADIAVAEAVIELKEKYRKITLNSLIPYETQANGRKEKERERYYSTAEKCDTETLFQRRYSPDCIYKCINYGLKISDVVLFVTNGTPNKFMKYASNHINKPKNSIHYFSF